MLTFLLFFSAVLIESGRAQTAPTALTLQTPPLTTSATTNVTSPVHFVATAESTYGITGYAIYVDGNQLYVNQATTLNAWVALSSGTHTVHITAWDQSSGYLTIPSQTTNYSLDVTGFAVPTQPPTALTLNVDTMTNYKWAVEPNPGGNCETGTIGTWSSTSDPDTANAPDPTGGQEFTETNPSTCNGGSPGEDNTLYAWKDTGDPKNQYLNFLWDFWFYVPTAVNSDYVQALENDFFTALTMSDGNVHEFMYGSQCYYDGSTQAGYLDYGAWTATSDSCQPTRPYSSTLQVYTEGVWHHVRIFYQRATPGTNVPYQNALNNLSSSNDTNTDAVFGVYEIDGYTYYWGYVVPSTVPSPAWSPVIAVQHQLDMPSSASGKTINEYVDDEFLYAW